MSLLIAIPCILVTFIIMSILVCTIDFIHGALFPKQFGKDLVGEGPFVHVLFNLLYSGAIAFLGGYLVCLIGTYFDTETSHVPEMYSFYLLCLLISLHLLNVLVMSKYDTSTTAKEPTYYKIALPICIVTGIKLGSSYFIKS
eukprot:TRINITY_DN13688_c0_g1_i1.p1 TRINITY_DN13688_c0_g1~~TRINITY_DN13688_c0_g1_i1.p1  ORF type:complete len:142 (-),score=30.01 TRINITY_DN13688_c0_g1_i1:81-506(-)